MEDKVTVTVDAKDLETLLFATGTIKQMEAAMAQHKIDPLVKMAKGRFTDAHERLNKAWNNATREEHPLFHQPATVDELSALIDLYNYVIDNYNPEKLTLPIWDHLKRMGNPDMLHPVFKTLRIKRYVELGNAFTNICWGDSGEVEGKTHPRVLLRITARGMKVLGDIYEAQKLIESAK